MQRETIVNRRPQKLDYQKPTPTTIFYEDSRLNGKYGSPLEGNQRPVHDKLPEPHLLQAQLNHVGWSQFKYQKDHPDQATHVIDVLIEEPGVSSSEYAPSGNQWLQIMAQHMKADTHNIRAADPHQFLATRGQRPLPERIRINSISIIAVLSAIMGFHTDLDKPFVIPRPFKSLTYHENDIRERLQQLEAECHESYGRLSHDRDIALASDQSAIEDGQIRFRGSKDKNVVEDTVDGSGENYEVPPPPHAKQSSSIEPQPSDGNEVSHTHGVAVLQHLRCLLEFIEAEIHSTMERFQAFGKGVSPKAFFSDLWYLFHPGDDLIRQKGQQACRIISIQTLGHYSAPPKLQGRQWSMWSKSETNNAEAIILNIVYIDFDGSSVGPVQEEVTIYRYDGQKSVYSLSVYPLRLAQTPDLRLQLVSKGKMFVDFINMKHMIYTGLTLDTRDDIDGEVMIDFEEALSVQEEWMTRIDNVLESPPKHQRQAECAAECCNGDFIDEDFRVDQNRNEDYMSRLIPRSRDQPPPMSIYPWTVAEVKNNKGLITEGEFLIMSRRTLGFILHSRKWGECALMHIVL